MSLGNKPVAAAFGFNLSVPVELKVKVPIPAPVYVTVPVVAKLPASLIITDVRLAPPPRLNWSTATVCVPFTRNEAGVRVSEQDRTEQVSPATAAPGIPKIARPPMASELAEARRLNFITSFPGAVSRAQYARPVPHRELAIYQ